MLDFLSKKKGRIMNILTEIYFKILKKIHYVNSEASEKLSNLRLSETDIGEIEELLKRCANPNVIMWDGSPALINIRTAEQTALFLKYGADPNLPGRIRQTALQRARTVEQTKLLHQYGAIINHQDMFGNTPLIDALNVEQTRYLLENGANPNVQNELGCSALLTANDPVKQIPVLLQYGADPFVCDNRGQSALYFYKDNPSIISIIRAAQEKMKLPTRLEVPKKITGRIKISLQPKERVKE